MTEKNTFQTPNTDPHPKESIEDLDAKYGVQNFSIEDTLKQYFVRRSDGAVEPWALSGAGETRAKMTKYVTLEDGNVAEMVKYLDMQKMLSEQSELFAEFQLRQQKLAEALGGAALNVPDGEKEQGPYDRLRTILPVITRPSGTAERYEHGRYSPKTDLDKQREYYDRYVTDENRLSSLISLEETIKSTPHLGDILEGSGIDPNSLAAVDAIRENEEVRLAVAKVIAEKLDYLADVEHADLGYRVLNNSEKTDGISGKRYKSRDYAVLMALKEIGGEFSTRIEGSDRIEDAGNGNITGQHRHAARAALFTYGIPLSQ